MENCVFCKIVNKESPASIVYEDANTLAFLDITPVNSGHTLVVPKQHHETLADVPEELLAEVIATVQKVAIVIKNVTKAQGYNLGMNNHKIAGQLVPHAHFHIIPRFEGDGLKHWHGKKYEEGVADKIAEKIRKSL